MTFVATVSGISPEGGITGFYQDASGVNHGYVRASDGAITTFDAPGAGTSAGQDTSLFSNNSAGAVTGWEIDASGLYHGFLLIPQ